MSYAVILVAWLAMMPQLMPKQRTDFFDWAMSTLLPAVTLVLEGVNPCAQLGACLALVHAQGHEGNGRKPRGFWSVRKVRGTLSVCSTMKRKHHTLHVNEFLLFPPPQRGARPMDSGKNKCWVTGHALGEHSPTGRLSNSDRPSA